MSQQEDIIEEGNQLNASSELHGMKFDEWSYLDDRKADEENEEENAEAYKDDTILQLNELLKSENSQFYPPTEVFHCDAQDVKIFNQIDPETPKQGVVKDSSIIASIISLANNVHGSENKPILSEIIHPQNETEAVFQPNKETRVKLFINGANRSVLVDSNILCFGSAQDDAGSDSGSVDDEAKAPPTLKHIAQASSIKDGEIWVSLLEKALLKVFSGGFATEDIHPHEVIHALSGFIPSTAWSMDAIFKEASRERRAASERKNNRSNQHSHHNQSSNSSQSRLWKDLCSLLKEKEAVVTVSIPKGRFSAQYGLRYGIEAGQHYSLLDAVEFNGIKLIKLKNPNVNKEWQGKYSNFDIEHWTPGLQREANFELPEEDEDVKKIKFSPLSSSFTQSQIDDDNKTNKSFKDNKTNKTNKSKTNQQQQLQQQTNSKTKTTKFIDPSTIDSKLSELSPSLLNNKGKGIFWMELSDAEHFFKSGISTLSYNPNSEKLGLFNMDQRQFVYPRKRLLMETQELQTRYAPQFLIKKQANQRIWILLTRHYQNSQPCYKEGLDPQDKDEDINIFFTVYKHGDLVNLDDSDYEQDYIQQQLTQQNPLALLTPIESLINDPYEKKTIVVNGDINRKPLNQRIMTFNPLRMERVGRRKPVITFDEDGEDFEDEKEQENEILDQIERIRINREKRIIEEQQGIYRDKQYDNKNKKNQNEQQPNKRNNYYDNKRRKLEQDQLRRSEINQKKQQELKKQKEIQLRKQQLKQQEDLMFTDGPHDRHSEYNEYDFDLNRKVDQKHQVPLNQSILTKEDRIKQSRQQDQYKYEQINKQARLKENEGILDEKEHISSRSSKRDSQQQQNRQQKSQSISQIPQKPTNQPKLTDNLNGEFSSGDENNTTDEEYDEGVMIGNETIEQYNARQQKKQQQKQNKQQLKLKQRNQRSQSMRPTESQSYQLNKTISGYPSNRGAQNDDYDKIQESKTDQAVQQQLIENDQNIHKQRRRRNSISGDGQSEKPKLLIDEQITNDNQQKDIEIDLNLDDEENKTEFNNVEKNDKIKSDEKVSLKSDQNYEDKLQGKQRQRKQVKKEQDDDDEKDKDNYRSRKSYKSYKDKDDDDNNNNDQKDDSPDRQSNKSDKQEKQPDKQSNSQYPYPSRQQQQQQYHHRQSHRTNLHKIPPSQNYIGRFFLGRIEDDFSGYMTLVVGVDLEEEANKEMLKKQKILDELVEEQNQLLKEQERLNPQLRIQQQQLQQSQLGRSGYQVSNPRNALQPPEPLNPNLHQWQYLNQSSSNSNQNNNLNNSGISIKQLQQPSDPQTTPNSTLNQSMFNISEQQAQLQQQIYTLQTEIAINKLRRTVGFTDRWIGQGVDRAASKGKDLRFTLTIYSDDEIDCIQIPDPVSEVTDLETTPQMNLQQGQLDQTAVIEQTQQFQTPQQKLDSAKVGRTYFSSKPMMKFGGGIKKQVALIVDGKTAAAGAVLARAEALGIGKLHEIDYGVKQDFDDLKYRRKRLQKLQGKKDANIYTDNEQITGQKKSQYDNGLIDDDEEDDEDSDDYILKKSTGKQLKRNGYNYTAQQQQDQDDFKFNFAEGHSEGEFSDVDGLIPVTTAAGGESKPVWKKRQFKKPYILLDEEIENQKERGQSPKKYIVKDDKIDPNQKKKDKNKGNYAGKITIGAGKLEGHVVLHGILHRKQSIPIDLKQVPTSIKDMLPFFDSQYALLGAFQHATQKLFSQQNIVILAPSSTNTQNNTQTQNQNLNSALPSVTTNQNQTQNQGLAQATITTSSTDTQADPTQTQTQTNLQTQTN
ncbi:MAG: hypothetical protein EZS28_020802, partial [Streblomastix strix]